MITTNDGNDRYTALISCYGNTRSRVLTGAVQLHLDRLGATNVHVRTGGLDSTVQEIIERGRKEGKDLSRFSDDAVRDAADVDPSYGERIRDMTRRAVTVDDVNAADAVLVADKNLGDIFARKFSGIEGKTKTFLQYAGLKHPTYGNDLDDVSPRGSLAVINKRFVSPYSIDASKNESQIATGVTSGELQYISLNGTSYRVDSRDGKKAESRDLYYLGGVIAAKLVSDARKAKRND